MTDWEAIVNDHGPAVWQTAYRLLGNEADAADCFSDTFLCALEFSKKQKIKNYPALLKKIAVSRAIDRLRKLIRNKKPINPGIDLALVAAGNPSPTRNLEKTELAIELREALAQLPPAEAEVFCLRNLNDMSYKEIAKQLTLKTQTVGTLLHRAKKKLQTLIDAPKTNSKEAI